MSAVIACVALPHCAGQLQLTRLRTHRVVASTSGSEGARLGFYRLWVQIPRAPHNLRALSPQLDLFEVRWQVAAKCLSEYLAAREIKRGPEDVNP
jgi:hypothetical protein